MAYFNILFFSILVRLLCFATIKAQDSPVLLFNYCPIDNTTKTNSTFQVNLKTLLSSLSSNATGNTEFYSTTVSGIYPSEPVYGLFMCRGDVLSHVCHECIVNATKTLSKECSLSKQAVIWYEKCMVGFRTKNATDRIYSECLSSPEAIPWLFLGSVGGRVIYPSCFLRFEMFQFYMESDESQPPRIPSQSSGQETDVAQPPRIPSQSSGDAVVLKPNVDDLRLPPRDPIVRVQLSNGTSGTSVWVKKASDRGEAK
ncbi:cysteine-rich receptor-like protein kinase [Trifolium medium]|uniref:Cysteine-rich receptor-like protein kinase n=1 Tax=Trifolium medium TaxID=97028 RepID=A0A392LWL2_9FABA|nr:cysteine-rich receptor-like protein kinase [Trifolium medium]